MSKMISIEDNIILQIIEIPKYACVCVCVCVCAISPLHYLLYLHH